MQSSFLRRRVGVRAAFEVLRGMSFYETPLESPRFVLNSLLLFLDCLCVTKRQIIFIKQDLQISIS